MMHDPWGSLPTSRPGTAPRQLTTAPSTPSLRLLRSTLLLAALVLACVHVLVLPLAAESMAKTYPEVDYLRLPFTMIFGVALVAAEVVLLALWRLAPTLEPGGRRTPAQHVQLGMLIAVLVLIGVLLTTVNSYLNSSLTANPPLVAVGLFAGSILCWAMAAFLIYRQRPGARSRPSPRSS